MDEQSEHGRPDDRGAVDAAREAALRKREVLADEHESRVAAREQEADAILAAAEHRDGRADERDRRADERESAESLRAFLVHDEFDREALQRRREAAGDRSHSKEDRTEGAADRARLTGRHDDGEG